MLEKRAKEIKRLTVFNKTLETEISKLKEIRQYNMTSHAESEDGFSDVSVETDRKILNQSKMSVVSAPVRLRNQSTFGLTERPGPSRNSLSDRKPSVSENRRISTKKPTAETVAPESPKPRKSKRPVKPAELPVQSKKRLSEEPKKRSSRTPRANNVEKPPLPKTKVGSYEEVKELIRKSKDNLAGGRFFLAHPTLRPHAIF
jgi:hypothetical protein